ncbi:MAG: Na+/H+ antiporter subunit B [bacterium]|nr:Na+/H+ antiporter subunit B [bacterium]
MNSVILRTTTQLLITVLLLLSVFWLLRGHDLPGGGFIGGLVAAAALALYAIANGLAAATALLRVAPQMLVAWGLLLAVGAGFLALLQPAAYLTGQWWIIPFAGQELKLSSPLLFDIGVFLVVIGVVLTMVFALEER